MVFETTPISTYSSSPGSIYPALKGLEKAGLVAQRPPAGTRRVFHLTEAGEAALLAWLTAPVEEEEIARRLDMALLRFAFLEGQDDRPATLRFLESFEAAATAHAASLERFLDGAAGTALSLQSRIAVEHGLKTTLCSAAWAADARRRLQGETI
jgi:DNA-binding PadR family transcriptional regulator